MEFNCGCLFKDRGYATIHQCLTTHNISVFVIGRWKLIIFECIGAPHVDKHFVVIPIHLLISSSVHAGDRDNVITEFPSYIIILCSAVWHVPDITVCNIDTLFNKQIRCCNHVSSHVTSTLTCIWGQRKWSLLTVTRNPANNLSSNTNKVM